MRDHFQLFLIVNFLFIESIFFLTVYFYRTDYPTSDPKKEPNILIRINFLTYAASLNH